MTPVGSLLELDMTTFLVEASRLHQRAARSELSAVEPSVGFARRIADLRARVDKEIPEGVRVMEILAFVKEMKSVRSDTMRVSLRERDARLAGTGPAEPNLELRSVGDLSDASLLGEGSFGKVLCADAKPFGGDQQVIQVAVKVSVPGSISPARLDREVALLSSLPRHANVCPILGALCQQTARSVAESIRPADDARLLLEPVRQKLVEHGDATVTIAVMPRLYRDLKALFALTVGRPLSVRVVRGIWVQLMDAMSFLQLQNVAHCDLHPGNVMLARDGTLTLIDFGSAERPHLSDGTLLLTRRQRPGGPVVLEPWKHGKQEHVCPEARLASSLYSTEVPLGGQWSWELGVMMHMVASGGKHPFPRYPRVGDWAVHRSETTSESALCHMSESERSAMWSLLEESALSRASVSGVRIKLMREWGGDAACSVLVEEAKATCRDIMTRQHAFE